MRFDSILSTITTAALVGLIITHWEGSVALIKGVGDVVIQYIRAVQGGTG
jgi:hypothetical protein